MSFDMIHVAELNWKGVSAQLLQRHYLCHLQEEDPTPTTGKQKLGLGACCTTRIWSIDKAGSQSTSSWRQEEKGRLLGIRKIRIDWRMSWTHSHTNKFWERRNYDWGSGSDGGGLETTNVHQRLLRWVPPWARKYFVMDMEEFSFVGSWRRREAVVLNSVEFPKGGGNLFVGIGFQWMMAFKSLV